MPDPGSLPPSSPRANQWRLAAAWVQWSRNHAHPALPENRILARAEELARFGSYETAIEPQSGRHDTTWSKGMYRLLGRTLAERALSHDEFIERHVLPTDRQRLRAALALALQPDGKAECEYGVTRDDGSVIYLHETIEAVFPSMSGQRLHGIRRDISHKRQVENARFAEALMFQSMVDQLPGVPYLASLKEGHGGPMYVSPKVHDLLGYHPEEWASDRKLRASRLHPDDRKKIMQAVADARKNKTDFRMDYRIYHRDGSLLWIHDEARIIASEEGEPLFLQGVVLDITERKQAQHELHLAHQRLQQMIAGLDTLRDDEHKRLAREMHDDFGQLLGAMKMDLDLLDSQLPAQPAGPHQQLAGIRQLADTMIASMRRIIADLPPQALDDNDWLAALQNLTRHFSQRHRIACKLTLPRPDTRIDHDLVTALYRVVQEALHNVARHAQAASVEVQLDCFHDHLVLCVQDDGKGIAAADLHKCGSYGLVGMRERIAALKGEMRIDSSPGTGTAIQIVIPLDREEPGSAGI